MRCALRFVFSVVLLHFACLHAQAAEPAAVTACSADSAAAAAQEIGKLAPTLERVRVANRVLFLPSSGVIDLLLFRRLAANVKGEGEPENYRVVVMDSRTADALSRSSAGSSGKPLNPVFSQYVPAAAISAEEATVGPAGTDFMKDESTGSKTLLRYTSSVGGATPFNGDARIYILGCAGADGGVPTFLAALDTTISSRGLSFALAALLCVVSYCLAVIGTYYVRKSQRMSEKAGNAHPTSGTNYASMLRHFDPVVLTAGPNGRGSPAKLQILFFSILVLGLVFYIWMLTGHLTGLSTTVLLLMGISGLGATASAGTEVSKNRLDYENWTWLINRRWLPEGGVAEANMAQWKDIVSSDGQFDVYRFQMVTFSVLVGLALVGAGAHLTDLSSFDIPQALLGILGLSQVVYVAGKLVAPPSIADLDKLIKKLRDAEKTLRDSLDDSNARFLGDTVVLMSEDSGVKAAKVAYGDYLQAWESARTMFEVTLGRLVPEQALHLRPPFPVPHVVCATAGALPVAKLGTPYSVSLTAMGGSGPYTWDLIKGALPPGIAFQPSGVLSGTPNKQGSFAFRLQVVDSATKMAADDFTLQVDP
ncbi:hypothetical protein LMG28614_07165 [Paraburkholderia ultramafica]|uniref:Uncharacterized protein n=1 Tax=Paraburkholderia ultramafica TaxID=1544867 RepID=A0A6S7BQJ3_9BURK|nr:Ig domain-containing protein [Paraburkholderia ultramafica]CAB3809919.1 hypothetical protein LMG28614_07165 [Paraburkholderia ultramafica]